MARPESVAIGGYFPTPESVLPLLAGARVPLWGGGWGAGVTPEGRVKAEINKYLEAGGHLFWRNQSGSMKGGRVRLSPAGYPDLCVVLPGGRFCGIEVKKPGGKQSPKQVEFMERCRARGGLYLLAESVSDVQDGIWVEA